MKVCVCVGWGGGGECVRMCECECVCMSMYVCVVCESWVGSVCVSVCVRKWTHTQSDKYSVSPSVRM